jgi:hypothetical protein
LRFGGVGQVRRDPAAEGRAQGTGGTYKASNKSKEKKRTKNTNEQLEDMERCG